MSVTSAAEELTDEERVKQEELEAKWNAEQLSVAAEAATSDDSEAVASHDHFPPETSPGEKYRIYSQVGTGGLRALHERGRPIYIPRPPILAYCLVIQPTGELPNQFRRVGVAEVNYDWMLRGSKTWVVLL